MRVVALEEHFSVPALVRRIDPDAIARRGFRPRKAPAHGPNPLELLPEIGEQRLKAMDEFRHNGAGALEQWSRPRSRAWC